MPIVDIEGVGRIEFPEGMSEDQISEALKQEFDPVWGKRAEAERNAVLQTGIPPQFLKPALRTIYGEVISGEIGDTHPELAKKHKVGIKELDRKGFTLPSGTWVDRRPAKEMTGIDTEYATGEVHSTDLMREVEPTEAPEDTESLQPVPPQLPQFLQPKRERTGLELITSRLERGMAPRWQERAGQMGTEEIFANLVKDSGEPFIPSYRELIHAGLFEPLGWSPENLPDAGELQRMLGVPKALGIPLAKANQLMSGFANWVFSVSGMGQLLVLRGAPAGKLLSWIKPALLFKFAVDMTKGSVEAASEFWDALKRGDYEGAANAGGDALANLLFLVGGPKVKWRRKATPADIEKPAYKGLKVGEEIPTSIGFQPGLVPHTGKALMQAATMQQLGPKGIQRWVLAEMEPPLRGQVADLDKALGAMEANDPRRIDLEARKSALNKRLETVQNYLAEFDKMAGAIGMKVDPSEEPIGTEGQIAKAVGETIRLDLNQFRKAIEIDAESDPAKVKELLVSLLSEEGFHARIAGTPTSAEWVKFGKDYWDTLSWAEKRMEESLYPFPEGTMDHIKGHEAIRRRLQLAKELPPHEFLRRLVLEKWNAKATTKLEQFIQMAREKFPTLTGSAKDIARQKELLKQAEDNLRKANDASEKQKTAAVYGHVRAPKGPAGPVPPEGRGAGVLTPAETVAQKPEEEVLLNQYEQEQLDSLIERIERGEELSPIERFRLRSLTLKREQSQAKLAPTAQPGGPPQAAAAEGAVKPGVPAPGQPTIRTPTPEAKEAQDPFAEERALAEELEQEKGQGEAFASRGKPDKLAWLREEMQRRGLSISRIFNAYDLSDPRVREAIEADPTLKPSEKKNLLETGSIEPVERKPADERRLFADRLNGKWLGTVQGKDVYRLASGKKIMVPADASWEDIKRAAQAEGEAAFARRGKYHEGIPDKDIAAVAVGISQGKLKVNGQTPEFGSIRYEAAAQIVYFGYDAAIKLFSDELGDRINGLLNAGVDYKDVLNDPKAARMRAILDEVADLADANITYGDQDRPFNAEDYAYAARRKPDWESVPKDTTRPLADPLYIKTVDLPKYFDHNTWNGAAWGIWRMFGDNVRNDSDALLGLMEYTVVKYASPQEAQRRYGRFAEETALIERFLAEAENSPYDERSMLIDANNGTRRRIDGLLDQADRNDFTPRLEAELKEARDALDLVREALAKRAEVKVLPAASRADLEKIAKQLEELRLARLAAYKAGDQKKENALLQEIGALRIEYHTLREKLPPEATTPLGQQQLSLGGVPTEGGGKDVFGRPTERSFPIGTVPPPMSAQELAGAAMHAASMPVIKGTRPTHKAPEIDPATGKAVPHAPERTYTFWKYKDYKQWVKDNAGGPVGDDFIDESWTDAVYEDVHRASPERMADLIEALDLEARLGLHRDRETGQLVGIPPPVQGQRFQLVTQIEGERLKGKPKGSEQRRAAERIKFAMVLEQRAAAEKDPAAKDRLLERAKDLREIAALLGGDPTKAAAPGETVYRAGKKIEGVAERRARIESVVAQERLKDMGRRAQLLRTDIGLNDLAFRHKRTLYGAARKIDEREASNLDLLLPILRDEARGSKDEPVSHTRRVVALVDLNTVVEGKDEKGRPIKTHPVSLVSTYQEGSTQYIVDPSAAGMVARPSRPLNLAFLRRYRPICVYLLNDPVQNFHRRYNSVSEYTKALERDALKTEQLSEYEPGGQVSYGGRAFSGVRPKSAAEIEREEKLASWYELRGEEAVEIEGRLVEGTPGIRPGGTFTGPEAAEARAQQEILPGEIQRSRNVPLQQHEVSALYDWLSDQIPFLRNVHAGTVMRAIGELRNLAKDDLANQRKRIEWARIQQRREKRIAKQTLRAETVKHEPVEELTERERQMMPPPTAALRGWHRSIIATIQKVSRRLYEDSYDPEIDDYLYTPKEAYHQALRAIARDIAEDQGRKNFIEKTLRQFGARPDEPESALGVIRPGHVYRLVPPGKGQAGPPQRIDLGAELPAEGVQREIVAPGPAAGIPFRLQGRTYSSPLEFDPALQKRFPNLPPEVAHPEMLPEGKVAEPPARPPHEFTPGQEPPSMAWLRSDDPGPFLKPFKFPKPSRRRVAEAKYYPAEHPKAAPEPPFKLEGEELKGPFASRGGPISDELRRTSMALVGDMRRGTAISAVRMNLVGSLTRIEHQVMQAANDIGLASMGNEVLKGKSSKEKRAIRRRMHENDIDARAVIAAIDPNGAERQKRNKLNRKVAYHMLKDEGYEPTSQDIDNMLASREFADKHPGLVAPLVPQKKNLDILLNQLRPGFGRASRMMQSPDFKSRLEGRRYMKALKRAEASIQRAMANWDDPGLQATATVAQAHLMQQLEMERMSGQGIWEHPDYVPNELEGPLDFDNMVAFSASRLRGRNYRAPKTFYNIYEALGAGPYIPAWWTMSQIVAHRLHRGSHVVALRQWEESLKGMKDPTSRDAEHPEGLPLSLDPSAERTQSPKFVEGTSEPDIDEETGQRRTTETWFWSVPGEMVERTKFGKTEKYRRNIPGYILVDPQTGKTGYTLHTAHRPICIREGYKDIIRAITGPSLVRQYGWSRELLYAVSFMKHNVVLMLDSFHPLRTGQHSWASLSFGHKGGYTALSWSEKNMQRAADAGLIPQSSVDWAKETIEVRLSSGRTTRISRKDLLEEILVPAGLSPRVVSDALFRNVYQNLPVLGPLARNTVGIYNRWLFEHFIPGLIAETAVKNFERAQRQSPGTPYKLLARDIARDVNITYGQMAAHTIFKNRTLQDILTLFCLAPFWREGVFQRDVRFLARLPAAGEYGVRKALNGMGLMVDPKKNFMQRLTGREGVPPMGQLGWMIARGLASYFMLAQVVNLISRKKFTWENPEPDHKLDGYLPWGKDGIWLPTLSVFGEIMGDWLKYSETEPSRMKRLLILGRNALGPFGRMANVYWRGEDAVGRRLRTDEALLKEMAIEGFPPPISLGSSMRGIANHFFPERVSPNPPGMWIQRGLGSLGLRVLAGKSAQTQILRLAKKWRDENGIPDESSELLKTEMKGLGDLRDALYAGDIPEQLAIYKDLVQRYAAMQFLTGGKQTPEGMIREAMKNWAKRPLSGNNAREGLFTASLTPDQLELYMKADIARAEILFMFDMLELRALNPTTLR